MPDVHNVIVIGGGPAGYTAAIYAGRAQLAPLVFEGVQYGGALMQTTEVENFPGFEEGIQGPDLMGIMRKQAQRYGAQLLSQDVSRVDLSGATKRVWVGAEEYLTKTVVLAMGSAYRTLGIPSEEQLTGRGVSWCATCDGFFFRDRPVAVIGGGDSAVEEAMFLSRMASSVTVVHRRDTLRASKIMQERAFANPKLNFLLDSVAVDIHGQDAVEQLQVRNLHSGQDEYLDVAGVFIAVGHDPRSELVADQIPLDAAGYVRTYGRTSMTEVAGVFACGDLVDHTYRQAVTAAGTGCAAALDVERYLAGIDEVSPSTATADPNLVA